MGHLEVNGTLRCRRCGAELAHHQCEPDDRALLFHKKAIAFVKQHKACGVPWYKRLLTA